MRLATNRKWTVHALLAALLIGMTGPVSGAPSSNTSVVHDGSDDRVLATRASATVSRPADRLHVYIAVESTDEEAEAALNDNARRINAVINALVEMGIDEGGYETARIQIRPEYEGDRWDPKGSRKLIGYRVENAIMLTTSMVDRIPQFIRNATEAGASEVSVSLGLSDEQEAKDQAIADATAAARHRAEVLARAAGVRILRLKTVELDHARARQSTFAESRGGRIFGDVGEPPKSLRVKPGDVDVSASVTLRYVVAPATKEQN